MISALVVASLGAFIIVALRRSGARRLDGDWPVNFAHRGASARAPENTPVAFRLAAEGGAGGLETDVHVTRDGHVVAIHDDTVDRTTDGSGLVREMSLAELQSLDAGFRFTPGGSATYPYRGKGVRVPELREVLREFPDLAVNVDIKEARPGVEEAVLRVIEGVGAEDRTLVVSEHTPVIGRFRRLSGGRIRTGASRGESRLFYYLSGLHLEGLLRPAYAALQVPVWHGERELVTPRFLAAAHGVGVRVDVWTIDEPAEMRRLLDLGVDVVMTNRPGVLAGVLRGRGLYTLENDEHGRKT